MNNSFKTFFKGESKKPIVDKSISDKILEVCKFLYDKDKTLAPETLLNYAIDMFVENSVVALKEKIGNTRVYIFDEIKQKYPQEINNDKEESKNEPIEKNSRPVGKEKTRRE